MRCRRGCRVGRLADLVPMRLRRLNRGSLPGGCLPSIRSWSVLCGTLLRGGKCHVGLLHLLKHPSISPRVRVVFACRSAICSFDLFVRRRAAYAQNLIRIKCTRHDVFDSQIDFVTVCSNFAEARIDQGSLPDGAETSRLNRPLCRQSLFPKLHPSD